jgi:hypothetical protein
MTVTEVPVVEATAVKVEVDVASEASEIGIPVSFKGAKLFWVRNLLILTKDKRTKEFTAKLTDLLGFVI